MVVDFPFVPVTPITFAFGKDLAKISISLFICIFSFLAFLIKGCVNGMPGETII